MNLDMHTLGQYRAGTSPQVALCRRSFPMPPVVSFRKRAFSELRSLPLDFPARRPAYRPKSCSNTNNP